MTKYRKVQIKKKNKQTLESWAIDRKCTCFAEEVRCKFSDVTTHE